MHAAAPKMAALIAEGNRKVAAEIAYFIHRAGGPPNEVENTSECPHCRYWGRGKVLCVIEDTNAVANMHCSNCNRTYHIGVDLNDALYQATLDIDKALRSLSKLVNSELIDSFQAPHVKAEMRQRVGEFDTAPPSQPALMAFLAAYLSPVGFQQYYAMIAIHANRRQLITA